MSATQLGDRVQVHYVKRFSDGTVRSSRASGGAPLELTIGNGHPLLPGLGSELVGVAEGETVTLTVPPERAYGLGDPSRVRRVSRTRFGITQPLTAGRLARMQLRSGRTRVVRVVEVRGRAVVVDTNHPRCGQSVELELELVTILATAPEVRHWGP
jgi:FKBP-type peptidyl-prolyl cis-trans isomerase 2